MAPQAPHFFSPERQFWVTDNEAAIWRIFLPKIMTNLVDGLHRYNANTIYNQVWNMINFNINCWTQESYTFSKHPYTTNTI